MLGIISTQEAVDRQRVKAPGGKCVRYRGLSAVPFHCRWKSHDCSVEETDILRAARWEVVSIEVVIIHAGKDLKLMAL